MRGQIIEKSKGVYLVRIETRIDGKRKTLFSKTVRGTKKGANQLLTEKLSELDKGTFIESSILTLKAYLDKWLEVAAKPRLREQTFKGYQTWLVLYIRPVLGEMKLDQIKPLDVQAVYTSMLERGLKPRTVEYANAILRSSFKQAVKWNLLSRNPCDFVDLPKKQKTEMKAFSPEQASAFLKAAKDDKHGLIFEFALLSGMRPSEYLGLQWKDVDLMRGTITVVRSLVLKSGGGFCFTEPKTAKSRRTVPLPKTLVKELNRHRINQLEQKLKLGEAYQNLDLVFASEIGTPFSSRNLAQRNFEMICKKANLKGFRLYDLRHSCATLLLSQGENAKVVSERLGHASIVLTLDTYSHVLPTMQDAATERLERLLYGN